MMLICILPASTKGLEPLYFKVTIRSSLIESVTGNRSVENRDRDGAGVDTASFFCGTNSLKPVTSAFVLEPSQITTSDLYCDLLITEIGWPLSEAAMLSTLPVKKTLVGTSHIRSQ